MYLLPIVVGTTGDAFCLLLRVSAGCDKSGQTVKGFGNGSLYVRQEHGGDRGENNGDCFGHFNLTIIYLQFYPDLAIIYHTPHEVMRVSAIFTWEK